MRALRWRPAPRQRSQAGDRLHFNGLFDIVNQGYAAVPAVPDIRAAALVRAVNGSARSAACTQAIIRGSNAAASLKLAATVRDDGLLTITSSAAVMPRPH